MKQEIIKLAKEKGFESEATRNIDILKSTDLFYYLYLCEIQKWLRESNKFHITIDSLCNSEDNLENFYWMYDIKDTSIFFIEGSGVDFKTYEEALEKGCFEALKLID